MEDWNLYLSFIVALIGLVIFGSLSREKPQSVYLGVTFLLFGLMALQSHTFIMFKAYLG